MSSDSIELPWLYSVNIAQDQSTRVERNVQSTERGPAEDNLVREGRAIAKVNG